MKKSSTTKKAKNVIRNELLHYYPKEDYRTKTRFDAVNKEVKGLKGKERGIYTDYQAVKYMGDGGCFACYYSDQNKMLEKVYGKKGMEAIANKGKTHEVYTHLLAREFSDMKSKGQKGLLKRK